MPSHSIRLAAKKGYHHGRVSGHKALNRSMATRFASLSRTPDKESHFFNGRYENIYIDQASFPGLALLLACLKQAAGHILGHPEHSLKFGFWFNLMQPGDLTTSHSHDDGDELLSCVYYISVPENSGHLVLDPSPASRVTITPEEGDCLFFDPALVHEVTENLSPLPRLSLAGNFGPVQDIRAG